MDLLDLPWMLATFSVARLKVNGSRNLWLVATTGILVEPYLYEQGRYSRAEPLYERSLKITETLLAIAHPHTMTVRQNYVDCLQAMTNSLMTSNFPTIDFGID